MEKARTIGILGGMGPQASCELYGIVNRKCCLNGEKVGNSDFPHLIINNLPVPDLIADTKEKNKAVAMVHEGALALERAGATDILMSCNTMHAFQGEITEGLSATFHSLIELMADSLKESKKTLLLGSKTTISSSLYQKAFRSRGMEFKEPCEFLLEETVDVILSTIAKGNAQEKIGEYVKKVVQEAEKDGAIDTIALVCTELPMVFPSSLEGYRVVSSLEAAANKIMEIHFGSAVR